MADKTYELHIDESGTFGDWQALQEHQVTDCRVIGGVIVPADLAAREKELRGKLVVVQKNFFPAARTITGIHVSELKNSDQKEALRQSLQQIFQNDMAGARIVFIYDRTPAPQLEDLPGAKFYRNMLFHLLQTVVFFHPQFEPDAAFSLKLAHRRFSYASKFEEYLAGQGYLKLRSTTDGHTELTAVTAAELETSLESIQRALPFSNKRTVSCTVKAYEKWDSPFMVMADWICNTLLWQLGIERTDKDLLKAAEKTFGKGNILFFCPSDFDPPESMISAFQQGRSDHFLASYLQREKQTYIPDSLLLYPAYKQVIKKYSEEHESLSDKQCATLVEIADIFLQGRLYSRLQDVRQLLDILAAKLGEIVSASPDGSWDRLAWRYHDVGLRYANHTGDISFGRTHYESGKLLFKRLGTDRSLEDVRSFHEFVNRAAIISANEFAFERSCAFLEDVRQTEEEVTKILGGCNKIYGKICGTMAQNFAFMEKKDDAAKYFELAIAHLGINDTMQRSYRAHFYLDQDSEDAKNKYFAEVQALFSPRAFTNFSDAISECLTDPEKIDAFLLHLLLKGCLKFAGGDDKRTVVAHLEQKELPLYQHHPWALIYTVAGRLFHESNKMKKAGKYWQQCAGFAAKDQLTFKMLGHAAHAWLALSRLEDGEVEKCRDYLLPIRETFQALAQSGYAPGIFNPRRQHDSDGKIRPGWFDESGNMLCNELVAADKDKLRNICEGLLRKYTFTYW